MTLPPFLASLWPLGPELVIVVGAMVLLMVGVARKGESQEHAALVSWLAVGVLLLAGVVLMRASGAGTSVLFDNAVVVDAFARFMKLLVLVGAAGALILAADDMRTDGYFKFEYPVLVLLATAGMMMMISAGDLISLYLGLELQSLALYVMAAIRRDDVRSSEAGLKYFVLGALSSGMLLYGASFIYGFTGTTSFVGIASVAQAAIGTQYVGLIFGLVFLLVGLAFKISAVPFHMWTPDVYQGAPTPVTAFLAAAPKVAAMALLVRLLYGAFGGMTDKWQQVIIFLALASMILGAVAAIGQTSIKRLLAYSSIANMGFALVGVAAGTAQGVEGVIVYMAIYLAMTLGAFACLVALRRRTTGPVDEIEQLAGLSQTNLPIAAALGLLMFSLAGIPPLAGFFAKFEVFLAAVNAKLWPLAILGVIASVIGAYYYLRVVKVMFFDPPVGLVDAEHGNVVETAQNNARALRSLELVRTPMSVMVVIALSTLFVLLYVVQPALLVDAAKGAARSLVVR
jgi:NADH-quinone oxidoreductase subunit N